MMLTAELYADRNGKYTVVFDGEIVLKRVRDPEHALARALLVRGIMGRARTIDPVSGMHRMTIDIEKAAGRMVVDNESGLRFAKYTPVFVSAGRPGFARRGRPVADTGQRSIVLYGGTSRRQTGRLKPASNLHQSLGAFAISTAKELQCS